jgi:hypothetical protein
MGMEMTFDNYSAKGIEDKVIEVFKDKYDAEVVYVNPCFKIQNIYKLNDRYNILVKLKLMVELWCDDNGIKDEKDKKVFDGSNHKKSPKYPGGLPCKKKPVLMSELV